MYSSPAKLLMADHDGRYRRCLRDHLEQDGFIVREASDGRSLLSHLQRDLPHLVLLDLQLPLLGGLELCRRIKEHGDLPIVVLTTVEDEATKVKALDLFAEDYILKPSTAREISARVRRILRRTWLACLPAGPALQVDERLSLDFVRREARTPKGAFRLTPMESRLLQLLVRNAGQVLPNELLLERLWGDAYGSAASLWEYVRRVRHKIGDDACKPRYILNEPGLGYRFSRPVSAAAASRN